MSSMSEFYSYAPKRIDVDRGVTINGLPNGQGTVVMYDDMPGLFLNPNGLETDDERAELAGFDVKGLRREAELRRRIAAAERDVRDAFEHEEKRIRSELDSEIADRVARPTPFSPTPSPASDSLTSEEETFIKRRNAAGDPQATEHFTMEHQGAGFWVIADEHGTILTERIRGRVEAARQAILFERSLLESDQEEAPDSGAED